MLPAMLGSNFVKHSPRSQEGSYNSPETLPKLSLADKGGIKQLHFFFASQLFVYKLKMSYM
jgi:hypothetical protein